MEKSPQLPKSEQELQEREAAGLWQAQAFAKQVGEGSEKISIELILHIHKVFLHHAHPLIAGRFRRVGEDIKKLRCMTPPPGSLVQEKVHVFWRELDTRLAHVPPPPKGNSKKTFKKVLELRNRNIISLAAWIHYQITSIHPFCEGNGRMARLMTNLILYRHKLQPTDIKYEGENKSAYLDALCEIDREGDFRHLENLIIKGIMGSYKKLIAAKKNAARQ